MKNKVIEQEASQNIVNELIGDNSLAREVLLRLACEWELMEEPEFVLIAERLRVLASQYPE